MPLTYSQAAGEMAKHGNVPLSVGLTIEPDSGVRSSAIGALFLKASAGHSSLYSLPEKGSRFEMRYPDPGHRPFVGRTGDVVGVEITPLTSAKCRAKVTHNHRDFGQATYSLDLQISASSKRYSGRGKTIGQHGAELALYTLSLDEVLPGIN